MREIGRPQCIAHAFDELQARPEVRATIVGRLGVWVQNDSRTHSVQSVSDGGKLDAPGLGLPSRCLSTTFGKADSALRDTRVDQGCKPLVRSELKRPPWPEKGAGRHRPQTKGTPYTPRATQAVRTAQVPLHVLLKMSKVKFPSKKQTQVYYFYCR
jgi:hypothetical protein